MQTAFLAEFRADMIAVADKGEVPLRQIAEDFGISEACLHRWLRIADREDGIDRSGPTATVGNVPAELREAGEPVNEAARRCELAKTARDHLIASSATVDKAAAREWENRAALLSRCQSVPFPDVATAFGSFDLSC